MPHRLFPVAPHARRRLAFLAVAAGLVATATAPAGAATHAGSPKLKLPAERTSPTGNFFTLEADQAPTSTTHVAQFEMRVCTSSHTPAGTAIAPALFTLSLGQGGTVPESITAAKHPAIVPRPLKPLQCTEGWLGFAVPKGKTATTLEYDYNGTIAWRVG